MIALFKILSNLCLLQLDFPWLTVNVTVFTQLASAVRQFALREKASSTDSELYTNCR
jgi:hypothetical protein